MVVAHSIHSYYSGAECLDKCAAAAMYTDYTSQVYTIMFALACPPPSLSSPQPPLLPTPLYYTCMFTGVQVIDSIGVATELPRNMT